MKNLFYSISVFALLVAASRTQAQLDETTQDWDAHCGKAIQQVNSSSVPGGDLRVYAVNGYEVVVMFVGGKAGDIINMHKANKAAFTDGEIDSILQSNQGKFRWHLVEGAGEVAADGKPEKVWNRPDGWVAVYAYDSSNKYRYLAITTKWYADYCKAHGAK